MRPRTLLFITLLALCRPLVDAQTLTNAAPSSHLSNPDSIPDAVPAGAPQNSSSSSSSSQLPDGSLPDDPGQEMLPVAQPEPAPATGMPVEWEFDHETWVGDVVTLTGHVVFHYRDYVLRADKVVYNRVTTELEADGHLQLAGGPNDVMINASHGDMRLDMHTARLYDVAGTQGVRVAGHTVVYSTTNPLVFSARVVIQTGEGNYRLIDGMMTNCRLPRPDWRILAHSIALTQRRASTSNSIFELLGVPIFYLPYLRHAVAENDRESGFLIPVISNGSSIRGYTFGEQVYFVINRSMDMVLGTEYFSKRGWSPNGDFRYKGLGYDHITARGNGLFDRGIEETTATGTQFVNQSGADIVLEGIKTLSEYTRVAGTAEYLSSYVYRLVFSDNYAQAINSQVNSNIAATHAHNGWVPSVSFDRFQTFASTTNGDEVRLLHLPNLRYDVLDRPLGSPHLYWDLGSSLNYLSRSEPDFHARNVGRFDFYPQLTLPLKADGWDLTAEAGLRGTSYTISQTPTSIKTGGIPTISHDPIHRIDGEVAVDIRPPALERDFDLRFANRELRHVIEPEIFYRYVTGVGAKARNVLQFDTTDIVTNTNEAGYSLTQRLYMRRKDEQPCESSDAGDAPGGDPCPQSAREWASWQVVQKAFIDPSFGGALIPGRRNVFESSLDLAAITFLTSHRNISPVVSRMRFEAIDNLRIEWDLEYDPKRGMTDADNLFAGYSLGKTTFGFGHALINAVDENPGSSSPNLKSQIIEPFIEFGKQSSAGFNLAADGGYDIVQHTTQYAGVQAVYNWDCCGLTLGYRRFELGTSGPVSRDETQWLYSFTLANFGSVGDIRRANSVFRDPSLPPAY